MLIKLLGAGERPGPTLVGLVVLFLVLSSYLVKGEEVVVFVLVCLTTQTYMHTY